MGIELLLVLLGAWLVVAPDRVSLAASRGAVGAVRAGTRAGRTAARSHRAAHPKPTRPAGSGGGGRGNWVSGRTSTSAAARGVALVGSTSGRGRVRKGPRGRAVTPSHPATSSTPPAALVPGPAPVVPRAPSVVWPVLRAATVAGLSGARAGIQTARERRTQGTDRTIRLARAARRIAGLGLVAAAAARATPGGLRERLGAARDAIRTHRQTQNPPPEQDTNTPATASGEHDQDQAEPKADPVSTTSDTTLEETPVNTTGTTNVGGSELATIADLRSEVGDVDARLCEAADLMAGISDWASTLSERYAAAPYATAGLTGAIGAVVEALGAMPPLDDAVELLAAVTDEAARAEALGEVADELGASGDVDAFRAA